MRQIETKILGFERISGDYLIKFQTSESFAEENDTNNVDAKFRAECRIRSGDEICGTLQLGKSTIYQFSFWLQQDLY